MKSIILTLILLTSLSSVPGQKPSDACSAFSEGCWTLIGASDGVELYVTYKKNARPGIKPPYAFNITVYSKLVNTNDRVFETINDVKAEFYYYDPVTKLMTLKSISQDKRIQSRQTIVNYTQVATDTDTVQYSQIKSFIFKPVGAP